MSEVKWEDLEIVGGESAVLHNSCDLEAILETVPAVRCSLADSSNHLGT